MKKIVAFLLSATMCLSLLTALTPAFAYEQEGEQNIQMRTAEKPDRKPMREPIAGQEENN